jgi:hypothetical protein
MMRQTLVLALAASLAMPLTLAAQQSQPLSPRGAAATHVAGKWVKTERGQRYEGGQWIRVDYSRPIKRGRDLFGSGADYGKQLLAGAPVWRAGANQSTRLTTEAPIVFAGRTLPAGEYSLFVDLKSPSEWTLILSSHAAQEKFDANDKTALWGSYNYTTDKDVLRAAMKVDKLPFSVDQFTIAFLDVTDAGGRLALMWDTTIASVPFTVSGT